MEFVCFSANVLGAELCSAAFLPRRSGRGFGRFTASELCHRGRCLEERVLGWVLEGGVKLFDVSFCAGFCCLMFFCFPGFA